MATILFIDTACAAFPMKGKDWKPHCVRMAASLEHDGQVTNELSLLVRPESDWVIETSAAPYHKATRADFTTDGVSIVVLAQQMDTMLIGVDRIVCHNSQFHGRLLRSVFTDAGIPIPRIPPISCTMLESTEILKLASSRFGVFKSPKLSEAYRYYTGTPLPDQHSWHAFGRQQVEAVRLVYGNIQEHAEPKQPDPAGTVARHGLGF